MHSKVTCICSESNVTTSLSAYSKSFSARYASNGFPIYKSNTVNAYRNTFGQFDKDSLEKKGDFDFCLREEKSGKFTLERITEGKIPNAHRMTVICPHHDQHRMTAIDNHTFICTECDPRLSY